MQNLLPIWLSCSSQSTSQNIQHAIESKLIKIGGKLGSPAGRRTTKKKNHFASARIFFFLRKLSSTVRRQTSDNLRRRHQHADGGSVWRSIRGRIASIVSRLQSKDSLQI